MNKNYSGFKLYLALAGALGLLTLLAACDNGDTPTPTSRSLSILNGTNAPLSSAQTATAVVAATATLQPGGTGVSTSNPTTAATTAQLATTSGGAANTARPTTPVAATTAPVTTSVPLTTLPALVTTAPPAPTQATGVAATEDKAVALLSQRFQQDRVYPNPSCLSYMKEAESATYFDFAVREKHGDGCPGDPSTAPVLDRFRVFKADGTIQWLSILTGQYTSYNEFRSSRQK